MLIHLIHFFVSLKKNLKIEFHLEKLKNNKFISKTKLIIQKIKSIYKKIMNYNLQSISCLLILSIIPQIIFSLSVNNLSKTISNFSFFLIPQVSFYKILKFLISISLISYASFIFNQKFCRKIHFYIFNFLIINFIYPKNDFFNSYSNNFIFFIYKQFLFFIFSLFLTYQELFNRETEFIDKSGLIPYIHKKISLIFKNAFFISSISNLSTFFMLITFSRKFIFILYFLESLILLFIFIFFIYLQREIINYNFTMLMFYQIDDFNNFKEVEDYKFCEVSLEILNFKENCDFRELHNYLNKKSFIFEFDPKIRLFLLKKELKNDEIKKVLFLELKNLIFLINELKTIENEFLRNIYVKQSIMNKNYKNFICNKEHAFLKKVNLLDRLTEELYKNYLIYKIKNRILNSVNSLCTILNNKLILDFKNQLDIFESVIFEIKTMEKLMNHDFESYKIWNKFKKIR